jgi:hypothetical protein
MTATGLDGKKSQTFAEIFLWWTILAIFAAAVLLVPASRAGAQTSGPLPSAAPSDQPVASSRAAAPAQIGGKPNIAGTWALNKDESDDPRAAMRQAGNSGGNSNGGGRYGAGGGTSGGGGWGGGGGQRGGSGGAGGGGNRRGGQNGPGAMNNLSHLTIEQTPSSAKVTGDSGNVLALYSASESAPASSSGASSSNSSGSASSSSTADSETATAPPAAQWQGSQLVAVTPGRRQGSTTRTYELSPDGKQLYVTTKIDSPRFTKPVTFRLVYDPAPSGG